MKRFSLLTLLIGTVALGATTWGAVVIFYQQSSGVALSMSAPTATSGHPLNSWLARDAGMPLAESYMPTQVWPEVESQTGTITGGTLRVWKQSNQIDGGWGLAPALDMTIPNVGQARWVGPPIDISGADGRIYFQTSSVTESGGNSTVNLVYGFRLERP